MLTADFIRGKVLRPIDPTEQRIVEITIASQHAGLLQRLVNRPEHAADGLRPGAHWARVQDISNLVIPWRFVRTKQTFDVTPPARAFHLLLLRKKGRRWHQEDTERTFRRIAYALFPPLLAFL